MSGVFGIVDSRTQINQSVQIEMMAESLSHMDWHVTEWYEDPTGTVALGRIGIGIFNKRGQPVVSENKDVFLFMSGEIYTINGNEVECDYDACEETILNTYLKYGKDFARYLNGAFVIAIWDTRTKEVIVTNDRFGLYPIFYSLKSGRMSFSPEMKGIFCDGSFEKRLDLTALAQYTRFQYVLGKRTFFEGIELLESASVLVFNADSGESTLEQYWSFNEIPSEPNIGLNEASEEAGRLLRQAVERLSGGSYQPGVYLSGGMDSRTILGLIDRRPITSITFGHKDSRDVYLAERVARLCGSQHTWIDMPDGCWVKDYVDLHMELVEGLHSWIHMHGINTLETARNQMDVNLFGVNGGEILGPMSSIDKLVTQAVDDNALVLTLFQSAIQKDTWPGLNEAEEHLVFHGSIRSEMRGRAFGSFKDEVGKFFSYPKDNRGRFFYTNNGLRRLNINIVTAHRSHIETRFPYMDYDLFSFIHSVPSEVKANKKLFRKLIYRETPKLAFIPYDHDEFFPMPDNLIRKTHAFGVRLKRRINKHISPIFHEYPTLYADYEGYLRNELRPWAEGILFDPRTAERGIFDQSFLRSLMTRHCSGMEEWTIGKIAPIITYEMMLRRFFD